jgi:hypothetical protein
MTIFLILNSGMDFYIWKKIVEPKLKDKVVGSGKGSDTTNKPPTAGVEQPAELKPVGGPPQTAYQD